MADARKREQDEYARCMSKPQLLRPYSAHYVPTTASKGLYAYNQLRTAMHTLKSSSHGYALCILHQAEGREPRPDATLPDKMPSVEVMRDRLQSQMLRRVETIVEQCDDFEAQVRACDKMHARWFNRF